MKNLILIGVLLSLAAPVACQQGPFYVGIPSEQMNYFSASQQQSQWCWAASIKMVFNYYGVGIEQDQIVRRTYGMDPYGNLPNWPGSFQAIHSNLNNWSIDNYGNRYTVTASIGMGAPTPAVLLRELSEGRPVILGYQTGPNSGHAVVATAASYIQTPMGPQIQTIVVRDPWPSRENLQTMGRQEWPGLMLANRIQAYWYVRVFR